MLTWSTHPIWVDSNLSPRGGTSAPYRASKEQRGPMSVYGRTHAEGTPVSELNADRAETADNLDALLAQPGIQTGAPGRVADRNEVPGRHMPGGPNARSTGPRGVAPS